MRDKGVPDMVVAEPQLMQYPTNVGAPAFMVPDVLSHKNERGVTATHYFETKFDELREEYFKLVEKVNDTEMVYNATYNFVPAVGRVYYLYNNHSNKLFLSIIGPDEWDIADYKGSFKFTTDNIWERVDNTDTDSK